MQLEMADFPVRSIRLGKSFRYEAGALEIDQQGLIARLRRDERIREAALEVALPGERVRITGVRDIVEPRVKVTGEGQIFPGTLSPVAPVGEGRTHRLSGMAVVAAVEYTNKFAQIEHPACLHKDGGICRYVITWDEAPAYTWERLSQYSVFVGFALALVFSSFLPLLHQTILTLAIMLGVLLVNLYAGRLEKEELAKSMVFQGDAARDLS